jgi:hypothetical protein
MRKMLPKYNLSSKRELFQTFKSLVCGLKFRFMAEISNKRDFFPSIGEILPGRITLFKMILLMQSGAHQFVNNTYNLMLSILLVKFSELA